MYAIFSVNENKAKHCNRYEYQLHTSNFLLTQCFKSQKKGQISKYNQSTAFLLKGALCAHLQLRVHSQMQTARSVFS